MTAAQQLKTEAEGTEKNLIELLLISLRSETQPHT